MGNRANVHVVDGKNDGVYLYTHWDGDELPLVVKTALSKRWRWDDPPYLARIIFDQMTAEQQGEETGFGISSRLCDNSHPIVQVTCCLQKVAFVDEEAPLSTPIKAWSFEEFIGLTDEEILEVYEEE